MKRIRLCAFVAALVLTLCASCGTQKWQNAVSAAPFDRLDELKVWFEKTTQSSGPVVQLQDWLYMANEKSNRTTCFSRDGRVYSLDFCDRYYIHDNTLIQISADRQSKLCAKSVDLAHHSMPLLIQGALDIVCCKDGIYVLEEQTAGSDAKAVRSYGYDGNLQREYDLNGRTPLRLYSADGEIYVKVQDTQDAKTTVSVVALSNPSIILFRAGAMVDSGLVINDAYVKNSKWIYYVEDAAYDSPDYEASLQEDPLFQAWSQPDQAPLNQSSLYKGSLCRVNMVTLEKEFVSCVTSAEEDNIELLGFSTGSDLYYACYNRVIRLHVLPGECYKTEVINFSRGNGTRECRFYMTEDKILAFDCEDGVWYMYDLDGKCIATYDFIPPFYG